MTLLVETTVSFSELEHLQQVLLSGELEEKPVLQAAISDRYSESKLEKELRYLRQHYVPATEGER